MTDENEFTPLYTQLRQLFIDNTSGTFLGKDEPGELHLYTIATEKPKPGEWFGFLAVKKNYVSYHLYAVYAWPDLLTSTSDALKKRMQGKSCFNFKKADDALFAELAVLTHTGWERFQKQGWPV